MGYSQSSVQTLYNKVRLKHCKRFLYETLSLLKISDFTDGLRKSLNNQIRHFRLQSFIQIIIAKITI